MPIDTWFPLAIYYEDLPEAAANKRSLLEAIWDLEQSSLEKRNYEGRAWTGDIHGVERLHHDDRFAWLMVQIRQQAQRYLAVLGIDQAVVELYVQRAWPVISRYGEEVGPHRHLTANISGVYYVSVPNSGSDESGALVFLDDDRRNELSPGIGSDNTEILTEWNVFNQDQAAYAPTEGRLLLFPSKQRHAVAPNETEGDRISISFDLIMTAKAGVAAGSYEFLIPPPSAWRSL